MTKPKPQNNARTQAQVPFDPDRADEMLAKGYPTDEELKLFPLGEVLISIPSVDPRYPKHIRKVFEGIEILLSPQRHELVAEWRSKPQDAAHFTITCNRIFGNSSTAGLLNLGKNTARFLRLLALYHDIGKSIIIERHPLVGSHLLRDVYRDDVENKLYPLLLGRDQADWQTQLQKANGNVNAITSKDEARLLKLFRSGILYHDYFGILSTGEGSLTAMVDLLDITGAEPEQGKELFSLLMVFNLADAYGSVDTVLPNKALAFCDDWSDLCKAVEKADGDRESFFAEVLSHSQTLPKAIRRLWRLIYEGAPADWLPEITQEFVGEVFKEVRLAGRRSFAANFALFAKLDYCLGFKATLLRLAWERKEPLHKAAGAMLTILSELEARYGVLCRREDNTWRRIGIEMAGLTRKPAGVQGSSKIGETISSLLLDPGLSGKQWAIGECTAWLMEE